MKKRSLIVVLAVLCLATSCFVGSTFAKYTSTVSGEDTAVVATWAFTQTKADTSTSNVITEDAIEFDLFNESKIGDTNNADSDGNDDDVADATNTTAVIAPGTTGSYSLVIKNDSQTNATMAMAFTETNANNIPLTYTYTIDHSNNTLDVTTDTALTFSAGAASISAIALNMGESVTITVTWTWAFGDDSTITSDTALGAAGTATVTMAAAPTFAQVD